MRNALASVGCKPMRRCLARWALCVLLGGYCFSQADVTPLGHPFSMMNGGTYDRLNLADLSVALTLPIRDKLGFNMTLVEIGNLENYTDLPTTSCSGGNSWMQFGLCEFSPGGHLLLGAALGWQTLNQHTCGGAQYTGNFHIFDSHGVAHYFSGSAGPCHGTGFTKVATDGSGITLSIITNGAGVPTAASAWDKSGTTGTFPNGTGVISTIIDSNNNITSYSVGAHITYIDPTTPAGHAVLTSSLRGSGEPTSYSYTAADQGTKQISISHTSLPINYSTFNCGGPNSNATFSFPSAVSYPDGSSFGFTYESIAGVSTGRIQTITLPTGGSVTYRYDTSQPNNDLDCSTSSPWQLSRTTLDGTWTYQRAGSLAGTSSTTVTGPPPDNNVTVYTFYEGLILSISVYQGSVSPSHLLKAEITCYNQVQNVNYSTCAAATTPTFPITQVDKFTTLPGMNPSHVETRYDSSNNVTYVGDYDFGAVTPTKQTLIVYGSWNQSTSTCSAISSKISDRPCSVTIEDSGGTPVAQTYFSYDSNGNLLARRQLVGGPTYLTASTTYNQNGTVNVATDVNGAQTTYGQYTCNGMLPTQLNEPLSLTRSLAWDCDGGVITSTTDENQWTTKYGYADANDLQGATDPFWRVTSVSDALQNVTNLYYAPYVSGVTNSYQKRSLMFNAGQSVQGSTVYLDSLGRPSQLQRHQAPVSSSFDTVSVTYDHYGRINSISLPCSASANSSCPTPSTTQIYDALDRSLLVQDGGNGTMQVTYSANDVLQVLGPVPSGENAKRIQYEYDGLGRLSSVCEVTSGLGATACGQTVSQTGYWTRYKYDALDRLIGVCQNTTQPLSTDCINTPSAGQQTRTFAYDGLSRLISETNPESGTTKYTYDSDSSGACPATYNGDLIKRVDSADNVTCYQYDALRRQTLVTYPSGPNATATPAKFFAYDTPYYGSLGTNIKGRLVAAGTCQTNTSCAGSSVVLETFGYSARGEITDAWERTPSFATVNHVTKTYWASGTVHSLSGVPGLPTIYYGASDGTGLDGEGRVTQVTAASGPNPIACSTPPCVSYNSAGQVTNLVFGSGDSDSYSYDPNTGRMTQYQFNVNGQSLVGKPGWNANGTLASLNITDPFNSGDNQTCAYGYDDLERIASVNCGSAWAQTFTYDVFGNITKSGNISWQPGYDSATNHYKLAGTSYDSGGDVLSDNFHNYQYDVDGNIVAVDVGGSNYTDFLTYDAFGSMVEYKQTYANGNPTWLAQQVYGASALSHKPLGKNILSGGTVYELPLPAGAEMMAWNGPPVYGHPDWLGSIRLNSTTGRIVNSDVAFAPFGEVYNSPTTFWYEFAGLNNNLTDNVWDADARRYHAKEGRWLSPDPAGFGVVDPSNPQTWNRYAYVRNQPLMSVDPSGLDSADTCYYSACVVAPPPDPVETITSDVNTDLNGPDLNGLPFVGVEIVNVTADPPPDIPLITVSLKVRPCSNVSAIDLDYSQQKQHIIDEHLAWFQGKPARSMTSSQFMFEGPIKTVDQAWNVMLYFGFYAFTFPNTVSQMGNAYRFTASIPPMGRALYTGFERKKIRTIFGIPFYSTARTEKATVVVNQDCKTVQTLYPGEP
jgi:RHS repeat-associated protein